MVWFSLDVSHPQDPPSAHYHPPHFPSSLTIKLLKIAQLYGILLNSKTSKYPDNEQLLMTNYYLYVWDEPFLLSSVKVTTPPWKWICGFHVELDKCWLKVGSGGCCICACSAGCSKSCIYRLRGASGRWGGQFALFTKGSRTCIPAWNWVVSTRLTTFSIFLDYVRMKAQENVTCFTHCICI